MTAKARMLIALIAALVAGPALAATASAAVVVRVETPQFASNVTTTMLPRKAVTPQPVQLTDGNNAPHTCAADSVAAALDAAIGHGNWAGTWDPANGLTTITKIANVPTVPLDPASTSTPWTWAVVIAGTFRLARPMVVNDLCTTPVPEGTEALFYPLCDLGKTNVACFPGGPLSMYIDGASKGLYDTEPAVVVGNGTPISIRVRELTRPNSAGVSSNNPTLNSFLDTDEGGRAASTNDELKQGIGVIKLSAWGDHTVRAFQNGMVPQRLPVCATAGNDGFCGTTLAPPNPFDVNQFPAPCATNGHDGFCGTVDTSGPVVHITNIKNKQIFKKKKGPGQIKGTMDVDPAGVGGVKVRLSRQVMTKVLIKPKKKKSSKKTVRRSAVAAAKKKKKAKKRYRTVTRCSVWNNDTLNIETAKCGKTTTAKWFDADLSDLRYEFSSSFAMALPAGIYTLEVQSRDEDGHIDPPTAGRNVLTFTVQ